MPDFLVLEEQTDLLPQLAGLAYTHDTFRGRRLKRGYAQFGYAYVSTGRRVEVVAEMPAFLLAIARRAVPHCPEGTIFNQCIVTHYPMGAGIGWHTDAPRFGECIAGVSLGGMGRFQLRPSGQEHGSFEIQAKPGSMYLMRGPCRWDYQHQILPVRTERYSLTFRHVREAKDQDSETGNASG